MKDTCGKFVFASAFAYFGGVALILLGYPPILNQPIILQGVAFFIMGILSLASAPPNGGSFQDTLKTLLSMVWGAMAAFTFVGFVQWAPDASAPYQLFMTLWDLVLAVVVLEE